MKNKFFAALGCFFRKPQVKAALITAAIVACVVGFFVGLVLWTIGTLIIVLGVLAVLLIVHIYTQVLAELDD